MFVKPLSEVVLLMELIIIGIRFGMLGGSCQHKITVASSSSLLLCYIAECLIFFIYKFLLSISLSYVMF